MKKIIIAGVLLLLMSGCAIMDAFKSAKLTTDTAGQIIVEPNSIPDPCGVKAEIDVIVGAGKTTTEIGLITGNPAVAGVGGLITLAGITIGGILLKRKK